MFIILLFTVLLLAAIVIPIIIVVLSKKTKYYKCDAKGKCIEDNKGKDYKNDPTCRGKCKPPTPSPPHPSPPHPSPPHPSPPGDTYLCDPQFYVNTNIGGDPPYPCRQQTADDVTQCKQLVHENKCTVETDTSMWCDMPNFSGNIYTMKPC